jgi:hypothetical protein
MDASYARRPALLADDRGPKAKISEVWIGKQRALDLTGKVVVALVAYDAGRQCVLSVTKGLRYYMLYGTRFS